MEQKEQNVGPCQKDRVEGQLAVEPDVHLEELLEELREEHREELREEHREELREERREEPRRKEQLVKQSARR